MRDYSSQLALFDVPFQAHGRVDVAVSCAAVKEPNGWFEPQDLDLETVKKVSSGRQARLRKDKASWQRCNADPVYLTRNLPLRSHYP